MIRWDTGCLQATMLAAGAGGGDFVDLLSLVSRGDARMDVTGAIDPADPGYTLPDGRIDAMDVLMLMEWHARGCL